MFTSQSWTFSLYPNTETPTKPKINLTVLHIARPSQYWVVTSAVFIRRSHRRGAVDIGALVLILKCSHVIATSYFNMYMYLSRHRSTYIFNCHSTTCVFTSLLNAFSRHYTTCLSLTQCYMFTHLRRHNTTCICDVITLHAMHRRSINACICYTT